MACNRDIFTFFYFTSIIAIQPLKFLKPNLNIPWTPLPILMKLIRYIMTHQAISIAYSINALTSITNITASQIVAVITIILLKFLNRPSLNLLRISCRLSLFQRRTPSFFPSVIPILQPLKLLRLELVISFNTFTNHHVTWYIYHTTWTYLNDALNSSFSPLIPTLQPFRFLRYDFNIAWTPIPQFSWNFVCIYITPPETCQWRTS
jgi:hypothetical protein